MTDLIRCDHCQTTVETIAAYAWWQVGTRAQFGMGPMVHSGMSPSPMALCSSRCLMEWTRERHDRDEAESEAPDAD